MCKRFLGIIQGDTAHQISMGIVDIARHFTLSQSISIEKVDIEDVVAMCSKDDYAPDLREVQGFLDSGLPDREAIQTLMEIPSAVLDRDAIPIKMLIFLARKGCCVFGFGLDQLQNKIRIGLIPKEMRFAAHGVREVMYAQPNICKAYADFLTEGRASSESASLVAALIAKDKNLYYFLTSKGLVQSSQDILAFMKHPPEGGSGVISGDEIIGLSTCPLTNFESLEKIPLKYALAAKKYAFLGSTDSLKMALLAVCKYWKIRLHCVSFRDEKFIEEKGKSSSIEEVFGEEYVIYDPQRDIDPWIVSALRWHIS